MLFSRLSGLAAIAAVAGTILTGCSSPTLAPTPQPTAVNLATPETQSTSSTPTTNSPTEPCASGNLHVGDLPAIDLAWREGVAAAAAKSKEWQQDAELSSLRVACQLFESDFRWQATFYSRNAQAFFSSDTGELVPSGFEDEVPPLNVSQFSFILLHDALNLSGFSDDTVISPSTGVEIRLNSTTSAFGPPSAPVGVILYHVAIERSGEVKDVFVDARDGAVYWYTNE